MCIAFANPHFPKINVNLLSCEISKTAYQLFPKEGKRIKELFQFEFPNWALTGQKTSPMGISVKQGVRAAGTR